MPDQTAFMTFDRPVAGTQVREPLPYRFSYEDGRTRFHSGAQHDLSTDVFTLMGLGGSDPLSPSLGSPGADREAAAARIDSLIRVAFADVETADLPGNLTNVRRPDLWQPQLDYPTPLWDLVGAGPTDGRKFDVPKFTSSSGLAGAVTEKTEPAGGSFVNELQTVTPTQVWGKVEITRQSWRAGGNPQLSGVLWDQMLRAYFEEREAEVAAFLDTLTAAADIALTGTPASSPDNDDDQVTAAELRAAITRLQFARGGNRFRGFAAHQALYELLARVTDDAGRPLHPQTNTRSGAASGSYSTLEVAGVTGVPAPALGEPGTDPTNSWLFDPAVVRGWVSTPQQYFWDFGATKQTAAVPQLSFVTVGIYSDVAFANLDITGVRQIVFDPSVDV